jgi:excisionase family DNA binding protein
METKVFISMDVAELKDLITTCITSALTKLSPQQETAPSTEPQYITRKEAAKILRVGLTKFNELTKSGAIPTYRIQSNIRLLESDVRASLIKVNTGKDLANG